MKRLSAAGRRVHRSCAETARECGILVLVFGLLDEHLRYVEEAARRGAGPGSIFTVAEVSWAWVGVVIGVGIALIATGIAWDWVLSS